MRKTDRQTITTEAERLERIAVDVEALFPVNLEGAKFQADKLRATASKLRALTVRYDGAKNVRDVVA